MQSFRAPNGNRTNNATSHNLPQVGGRTRGTVERRLKDANYDDKEEKRLAQRFLAVATGPRADADLIFRYAVDLFQYQSSKPRTDHANPGNDQLLTKYEFEKGIKEVKEAISQQFAGGGRTGPTTWAMVAAGHAGGGPQARREQPVPKKFSREIVVRATEQTPDLANRSPEEVVRAVNIASLKMGAIAMRKLPSGDIVVTFEEDKWQWHIDNEGWVKKAFGTGATLVRRTIAVYVRGFPQATLSQYETVPNDLIKALNEENKVKIARITTPKQRGRNISEPRRYTSLIAEMQTVEDARKIIDRGLVLQAQLFRCERYAPEARADLCYRCWEWGHKQRFCKKEARCALCACASHEGGENECPVRKDPTANKEQCLNCGGEHAAFRNNYRVAKEQRQRARENFLRRATNYAEPSRSPASGANAVSIEQLLSAGEEAQARPNRNNKRQRTAATQPSIREALLRRQTASNIRAMGPTLCMSPGNAGAEGESDGGATETESTQRSDLMDVSDPNTVIVRGEENQQAEQTPVNLTS